MEMKNRIPKKKNNKLELLNFIWVRLLIKSLTLIYILSLGLGNNFDKALNRVDKFLYQAKANGKSSIVNNLE